MLESDACVRCGQTDNLEPCPRCSSSTHADCLTYLGDDGQDVRCAACLPREDVPASESTEDYLRFLETP